MHICIRHGGVPIYPYSPDRLKLDNPGTSFPDVMSDQFLEGWGVFPVTTVQAPRCDPATEEVKEADPECIDGNWKQVWCTVSLDAEEIAQRLAQKSDEVRSTRNTMLAACDWTQLPGAPVDASQWSVYRQALRDLTDQPGFPWSVQWPISPASSHPPAAESIGQEWTAPDGTLWRVVQARGDDGQFLADDPATPERESLEWVPVP